MAVAEKTTVERTVTEEGFTLKLTVDEAETLVAVLARVGGSPDQSPRGNAESVLDALIAAGARTYYPQPQGHPVHLLRGFVAFDDYPAEV
ncbi:hypothetical protein [Streptomyces sp. NPDC005907]|uniref:hypothetical protein n=1 Tax=Streptomyces sp. NPDC005907 TaxID=3154571 RepID=UPI0033CA0BDC